MYRRKISSEELNSKIISIEKGDGSNKKLERINNEK